MDNQIGGITSVFIGLIPAIWPPSIENPDRQFILNKTGLIKVGNMMEKKAFQLRGLGKLIVVSGLLFVLLLASIVLVARVYPGFAAMGADELRKIIGDPAVAQMETILFKIDDSIKAWEFKTGLAKASPPWEVVPGAGSTPSPANTPVFDFNLNPDHQTILQATPEATSQPSSTGLPQTGQSQNPCTGLLAILSCPTGSTTPAKPAPWSLKPVSPLGNLPGEGIWTPYIQNSSGQTVAYKTFILPDPHRPYAVVAVVAFNLKEVRLNFVIGTQEPYSSRHPSLRSDGAIPEQDMAENTLLAAFNGGFKYQNGEFGAMANGLVSAPPRKGLATVAMFPNGQVKMGAWGTDILPDDNFTAYRQNGPLAIQDGQVRPEVADPRYWGFTISGNTVTWRSGLALSQDGNTLYYFAGPYLTINTLTKVMVDVGVWTGMQLDINNYWVHFDAFTSKDGQLVPEPLFPHDMVGGADRFLGQYSRDFFYITAK